jgi:hypothetical protein
MPREIVLHFSNGRTTDGADIGAALRENLPDGDIRALLDDAGAVDGATSSRSHSTTPTRPSTPRSGSANTWPAKASATRSRTPMPDARVPEPITASAWTSYDFELEGDDVLVHAELSDVDEVAVVVRDTDDGEVLIVHLDRVHAIAFAGQVAAAATADQRILPTGHGPEGPLA